MKTTAHVCPLFSAIEAVKQQGGTSCGNCHNFNYDHISHSGREVCKEYDKLVEISNEILSDR